MHAITLIMIVSILLVLYLHEYNTPQHNHLIHNDGTVNFCDVKTFEEQIIGIIPKKPMPLFSFVSIPEKITIEELSKVSKNFINELNKASNGRFHILKILKISMGKFLKFKVIDMTLQVYSELKNYTMLFNVIQYTDDDENI